MTTDQERAALMRSEFEAWIRKDCGDLSTFGTGENMHYRNSGVNHAWIGWKTATARQASELESLRQLLAEAVPWIPGIPGTVGDYAAAGLRIRIETALAAKEQQA